MREREREREKRRKIKVLLTLYDRKVLPKTLIDATQPRWSAPKPISRFCEDSAFYYDFFLLAFLIRTFFVPKWRRWQVKRHGNVSRWVTVDCDQMMIRVTVKKKNKKKDKKELVNTRTAVTYRRTFSPTPSTPPRRLPFNAALDYGVLFLSWNLPIFLIFFSVRFSWFFFSRTETSLSPSFRRRRHRRRCFVFFFANDDNVVDLPSRPDRSRPARLNCLPSPADDFLTDCSRSTRTRLKKTTKQNKKTARRIIGSIPHHWHTSVHGKRTRFVGRHRVQHLRLC